MLRRAGCVYRLQGANTRRPPLTRRAPRRCYKVRRGAEKLIGVGLTKAVLVTKPPPRDTTTPAADAVAAAALALLQLRSGCATTAGGGVAGVVTRTPPPAPAVLARRPRYQHGQPCPAVTATPPLVRKQALDAHQSQWPGPRQSALSPPPTGRALPRTARADLTPPAPHAANATARAPAMIVHHQPTMATATVATASGDATGAAQTRAVPLQSTVTSNDFGLSVHQASRKLFSASSAPAVRHTKVTVIGEPIVVTSTTALPRTTATAGAAGRTAAGVTGNDKWQAIAARGAARTKRLIATHVTESGSHSSCTLLGRQNSGRHVRRPRRRHRPHHRLAARRCHHAVHGHNRLRRFQNSLGRHLGGGGVFIFSAAAGAAGAADGCN